MKFTLLTALLSGLLFAGCDTANDTVASAPQKTAPAAADDSSQLQQLVRQLYEWQELQSAQDDFEPLADPQNQTYIGLDLDKHGQRLAALRQTGLFADTFLEDYNRLGLAIDEGLKSKKLEWAVGDLPPFGNGANPWCNCQDAPDRYWQTITLDKPVFREDMAQFSWTWGGDFKYRVDAVRENNRWKVAYLEGFDRNGFIATP